VCNSYGDPVSDATCALNATGTYTILAGDSSSLYIGTFNLFIERLNNSGDPTPIAFSHVEASAIDTQPELKAFTFTGSSKDRVLIRMLDTGGTSFTPRFWVYRPDGSELCNTYGNPIADIACILDATGTFTILAGDSNGVYTGSFNIYLQNLTVPVEIIPISYSQPVTNTISVPLEWHTYVFEGEIGDLLSIWVIRLSEELNLTIRIYRSDGSLLCEATSVLDKTVLVCILDDLPASELANTAPDSTATYTLLVGDSGGNVGSYELIINQFLMFIPFTSR
jgi:hypothetical protein